MEPAWIGCNARDSSWRSWGDETAVYHDGSGSTHLLTAVAGQVFQVLAANGQSRTLMQIADEVRLRGLDLDAEELTQILSGLEAVGLVHTASL